MARRCSICTHPRRIDIECDILNNVPFRAISNKYQVGRAPVQRHFDNGHIAEETIKAEELRKVANSEDLLDKLRFLQHEALKILDEAKNPAKGPPLLNTALNAIAKVHNMLETQGKLAGQLREQEINILINPTWLSLKQEIFHALKPFPEAQSAVFAAVAGADLSDVQKQMIEGERGYKDVTPAIKELIDSMFEEEPKEPKLDLRPQFVVDKEKAKAPPIKGLQPTRR